MKPRSEGLIAILTKESSCNLSVKDTSFPKEKFNTTHPFKEINEHNLSIASTGDIYQHNDSLIAAVIGNPKWSENSFNEISKKQGAAYALVKAFHKNGKKIIRNLSGEYAFILFDRRKNYCIAAVDHLSRYPLYYSTNDNLTSIGSSASSIHITPSSKGQISKQGIYNYFYFHMVPSPSSVYGNINKLPAGHLIEFQGNSFITERYWQPKFLSHSTSDFDILKNELKEKLRNAVENTISHNIKTGAFLSGGLDSSTVTGFFSELSDKQADAFSIGFSAEGYDEMPYARITAKHFGVELHEYYVTPEDVVEALPKVAASYDEPFGNSSALPAYFCARFAKENGVDRLLAGDGGDELFAGNERYSKQNLFENYHKIPTWIRTGLLEPLVNILPTTPSLVSKVKSYIAQANTPLPDRLQSYNFLHRHTNSELFTNDFLAEINSDIPLIYQREIYNAPEKASVLDRMLYLDWQYTLADNDLRKVTHMCSVAGLDVKYPMLDDELIDFSCSIPDKLKLKGSNLRYFYKEALRDWLPKETISKKKQGFGLPFGVWMRTHKPLQELAYDNLERFKNRGILKKDFIDNLLHLHQSVHSAYYGELVWIITVLELWLTEHNFEID